MVQVTSQADEDLSAELSLLRRRLARSEAARAQAEALLEDKSRVLAQVNEDLRANKELLKAELGRKTRQLLDAQRVAGFGTMIWDVEASRGELSRHCQTLLGLTGATEIDSWKPILDRVVPEDRDRIIDWYDKLTRNAKAADGVCPHASSCHAGIGVEIACNSCPSLGDCERMLEVRVIGERPEIRNRMIRILAETVPDENLGHMLVFLTLQDITREIQAANDAAALRQQDQRRLQELEELAIELRSARETADAANAAKTRFLAMMSHDIRTSMNGVIGMLTLFEEEGLTESQRETLALVRQSSDHLRILLDDIIDLERAESGKLKFNLAPMNSELFLQGVLGFWGKAAREKGLGFSVERMAFGWPQRAPDWAMADRSRMRQIVDNLLSNAVKYTAEGSITVRMGLVAAERLRFEIVDTGAGIPQEKLSELFEDFSQLYTTGAQRGGAGLGLAICKRLVKQMGGEIGVDAGPGGVGSCFWAELPWFAAEPALAVQADEPMILRHPDGRKPRILVVEDVATNRIVAQGLLRKLGCEVSLVEDGEQAVSAVKDGDYDLVLMDVSMPGMDGPTATRLIRELPGPVSEIPIVALTAYSRPEELKPMLNAGAMGTVNKPIVLEDMFRVLQSVCCSQYSDS